MAMLSSSRALLVAVAIVTSTVAAIAQFPRDPGAPPADPRIVSGADLGFRIDGTDPRSGNPTGAWVIRVNGRWVEVAAASGIRPAK